jgi:hypothetical protein
MARPAIPEASRRRFDDTVERLRAIVPSEWKVSVTKRTGDTGFVTVTDDEGGGAEVYVMATDRLEPRDLDSWRIPADGDRLVAARWLSPRAREILRDLNVNYLDRTGNVELRLQRPALYIRTEGARKDPSPKPTKQPNLRGPRVWALMRTMIEVAPPYTAGDLSDALNLDDGYVSRVLQVLSNERLISRKPRGPVTDMQWEPLLRQLARTYSFFQANEISMWVASSGPDQLLRDLAGAKVRQWAVTGSFATSSIVSVAAPEVAIIYAEDPERLAKAGRLLPTASGANVILAKPYNPIVFERGSSDAAFPCVSVAQIALDSLTGSARMPAEGEALIDWMRRNETRWLEPTLRG